MTTIVPPQLDLEHWHRDNDAGPHMVLSAMQKCRNSYEWDNRAHAVGELISWWSTISSYDPDVEPEYLITRDDLGALSKEVLAIAAAHRVRPSGLSFGEPTEKETSQWLKDSSAATLRQALEMGTTQAAGAWWHACLFEGADERYHSRTEHLVARLMPEHPFVHMATSLNMPLRELLATMVNVPSTPQDDGSPLPDLC